MNFLNVLLSYEHFSHQASFQNRGVIVVDIVGA